MFSRYIQRFRPYICFYVCITHLIGWHKPWNGLAHNTWGINVFIMQIDLCEDIM